ncbi:hypothetical protein V2H45_21350 [Tumidithrix elongata RA019]|uniref:Uncharacterized protein n=1 Tax=Tumidithrix elongata BACA0141 TaxID=2716417 RepID=A0AAW9Q5U2_9CYAN|nr:hypothetical protein [Tumidithrix elongata RA019]
MATTNFARNHNRVIGGMGQGYVSTLPRSAIAWMDIMAIRTRMS